MGALCVYTSNQQSNAVGSSSILLGVGLRAIGDARSDFREGNGAVVGQAGCERLLLHEVRENASIGGEASKSDAEMGIYRNDLLLV